MMEMKITVEAPDLAASIWVLLCPRWLLPQLPPLLRPLLLL